ncbi:Polyadenylate-binding protein 4 [Ranunculus cassubicifolius]
MPGYDVRTEETLIYDGFDITVTDDQLSDFFYKAGGKVVSITKHKGVYNIAGSVTYETVEQAKTAFSSLNGRLVNGKPIQLKISDLRSRLTLGRAKIFFNKFDVSLNEEDVRGVFEEFGTIISFKLITDKNGHSKGYGFVEFEKEEAAQDAILGLNGYLLNDEVIVVCRFVSKQEREEKERERAFK